MRRVTKIRKRNGRIVKFDPDKITVAVFKATQAVGEESLKLAKKVTSEVVRILNRKYDDKTFPGVEEIQDIVEITLIRLNAAKVAKAYILYREQHAKIREFKKAADFTSLVEDYIKQIDWRVRENSNMSFSLQGLNNHIASSISSQYWLYTIYSPEIREAHLKADFHLHDLGILAVYCCGWDLRDLLISGFRGAPHKVESRPAKHFRTALGQVVNFFYTLQGEAAGAQALANFDTYLAPFIHYDKLNYNEVKQCVQEFMFNMMVPTRVGFQCFSADTEILTSAGWKSYEEVKREDIIKTFNIKTGKIENQRVKSVFKRYYQGVMYNLKNRIQDQLISPRHQVVRKKFQTDRYTLEPIEDVISLRSPFIIPIAGKNTNRKAKISDEQIKLMAWIISEGSGGKVKRIRLNAESSRGIHHWFGTKERINFVPDALLNLDERQSKLFFQVYLKADGFEGCKIATTDPEVLDGLQIVAVNAGYGFTVLKRKPTIGKKNIYVLRLIKHKETYIQKVEKVNYQGIIWCPNTNNGTVIARRKGKVFITGNTPFTNVTLDVVVPKNIAEENVIIGGKLMPKKYKDFEKEMDMFNEAFAEVMLEGDAKGRVFTFPIPTYCIGKDFPWDKPALKKVWEMTAKYGIPYFSNFIKSDMKPEDARSMCPLAGEEKVLVKSSRGRGLEYSAIRNIYEGNSKQKEYEIYSDGKFVKGKFNKFADQKMLEVILENGHKIRMSEEHLNYVIFSQRSEEVLLKGKDLKVGDYLPYSLNIYKGEGGIGELGFFVGAYAGDGSFDEDGTVIFSLENYYKKELITKLEKIAKDYFGANSTVREYRGTKLVSLKVHSQAAVGLCRDFVEGKGREKRYKARLFAMSLGFRKGVLAGHYATDGGNRHRIYTSSIKMVETLNMLAATLGTATSVYKDSRGGRLSKEPNYAVLIYQLNRKKYGSIWFKKSRKLWIRIKDIRKIKNSTAYCFEVRENEPVFTVGTTGILTHNCRLRLDNRELRKRGGGLFAANPLTGSIGVVTLNMARLGYLSKNKKDLFSHLEHLMELARRSLQVRREVIEKFTEAGLYPYSKFYLREIKARFGEYWRNHFNTIGVNGVNEMLLNFLKRDLGSKEGLDFAKEVLLFMRNKLLKFQGEDNQLYNLEATPAEGTTYRFAKHDKKEFPDIIVANNENVEKYGADPYYTNSSHLPVGYTDDVFEALDKQDELQCLYTGGTVLHGFMGEKMVSGEAVKSLLRKVMKNYKLPYFSITPTFSICPKHGYLPGEHFFCPKCDEEIGYKTVGEKIYTPATKILEN